MLVLRSVQLQRGEHQDQRFYCPLAHEQRGVESPCLDLVPGVRGKTSCCCHAILGQSLVPEIRWKPVVAYLTSRA